MGGRGLEAHFFTLSTMIDAYPPQRTKFSIWTSSAYRRVRAGWMAANREMREQLAKHVEELETT